jgi:hypothetical protein
MVTAHWTKTKKRKFSEFGLFRIDEFLSSMDTSMSSTISSRQEHSSCVLCCPFLHSILILFYCFHDRSSVTGVDEQADTSLPYMKQEPDDNENDEMLQLSAPSIMDHIPVEQQDVLLQADYLDLPFLRHVALYLVLPTVTNLRPGGGFKPNIHDFLFASE